MGDSRGQMKIRVDGRNFFNNLRSQDIKGEPRKNIEDKETTV